MPFNPPSLSTIKAYQINYSPKNYLIGGAFSIFTTNLAAVFPSRKASKIDPVILSEENEHADAADQEQLKTF